MGAPAPQTEGNVQSRVEKSFTDLKYQRSGSKEASHNARHFVFSTANLGLETCQENMAGMELLNSRV